MKSTERARSDSKNTGARAKTAAGGLISASQPNRPPVASEEASMMSCFWILISSMRFAAVCFASEQPSAHLSIRMAICDERGKPRP